MVLQPITGLHILTLALGYIYKYMEALGTMGG